MSTNKLSVKELLQLEDCNKEVEIKGWVRTKRGNKQVNFVALNDGSTINNVQVVLDMNLFSDELMKKVSTGAAISVKGTLVEKSFLIEDHFYYEEFFLHALLITQKRDTKLVIPF